MRRSEEGISEPMQFQIARRFGRQPGTTTRQPEARCYQRQQQGTLRFVLDLQIGVNVILRVRIAVRSQSRFGILMCVPIRTSICVHAKVGLHLSLTFDIRFDIFRLEFDFEHGLRLVVRFGSNCGWNANLHFAIELRLKSRCISFSRRYVSRCEAPFAFHFGCRFEGQSKKPRDKREHDATRDNNEAHDGLHSICMSVWMSLRTSMSDSNLAFAVRVDLHLFLF
jgi:hypothetical protein